MSGFTGFADSIPAGTTVANAEFFPDIDLAKFQQEYRLPGEYRQEMLTSRMQLAMLWANSELAEWAVSQQAAGHASLAAVPGGDAIGGVSPLEIHYTRAVSCKAKAYLLQDYKTMMRKTDAASDAKEADDTEAKWHQFARNAINTMQGKMSTHAEAL